MCKKYEGNTLGAKLEFVSHGPIYTNKRVNSVEKKRYLCKGVYGTHNIGLIFYLLRNFSRRVHH